MKSHPEVPLLERILWHIPLLGYAMRLYQSENLKELSLFGLNVLLSAILLLGIFGYPALVILTYIALALAACFIFLTTRA
jgi:hypothetical protein